jgi:hypothetical protein
MGRRALILFFIVSVFCVFFFIKQDTTISGKTVSEWKSGVIEAFRKAEESILSVVDPEPDDSIVRPDKDVNKCPCKGSGYIVHGDGHRTECPYHFKSPDTDEHLCECDTRRTYCNCINAYGECGCQPKVRRGILDFIFGR